MLDLWYKVLDTIKSMNGSPVPEPFKISDTYQSAWKKRADQAGCEDDVDDEDEGGEMAPPVKLRPKPAKPAKAKSKAKKKSKTLGVPASAPANVKKRQLDCGPYTPHAYKEQRAKFIEEQRAKGTSYSVANCAWNLSREKAHLLCKVPVTELVRRRFLPKGSKSNPWSGVP